MFDLLDNLLQVFKTVAAESYFNALVVEYLARFATSLALIPQARTLY